MRLIMKTISISSCQKASAAALFWVDSVIAVILATRAKLVCYCHSTGPAPPLLTLRHGVSIASARYLMGAHKTSGSDSLLKTSAFSTNGSNEQARKSPVWALC